MNFISRNKNVLSLMFMVLFSFTSMAVQTGVQFSVKGIVSVAVSPFQKIFHGTYSTIERLWAGLTELNYLRDELARTRARLEQYEAVSQNLDEIKKENQRLRQLLGFDQKSPFQVIPAEVIAKNPDNYFQLLIVNKGSSDGVKRFMPVVAYHKGKQAVVGKVVEVRWNLSKIVPITDSQSLVGVMLQSNRYVGLLKGMQPGQKLLTMDYVSSSAEIALGEEVISSGHGGLFPKGLLVGTVRELQKFPASGFRQCLVEPHIDFGKLDQVLIIKKNLDQELQDFLKKKDKKN